MKKQTTNIRHKQLEREYNKAWHRYPHVYWGVSDLYPNVMFQNVKLSRKKKKQRQKFINSFFGGI